MASGLAVVVDKPFAATEADASRLIEKSEEVKRPLIDFQNRRWDGDFLTVREIVDSGELGEVYQFESSFEHWAPEAGPIWRDVTPLPWAAG